MRQGDDLANYRADCTVQNNPSIYIYMPAKHNDDEVFIPNYREGVRSSPPLVPIPVLDGICAFSCKTYLLLPHGPRGMK